MKSFRATSFRFLLILGILGVLVACGAELPVRELAEAKSAITRAKESGAEKYAPGEYEEARKSLFTAHEKASNEDLGETKKSAVYARAKALDAQEKSFPSLTEESKKQATAAIDEAEEAFASQLAAEPYTNAVELRKEGDTLRDNADRALESYPKESGDDAKLKTRLAAFEQYEQSNKKYLDSKKSAQDAKALALSQKQQLIDSLSDIEKNLDDADRYAGGQDPEVGQTRQRLNATKSKIDEGKIKEGYSEVEDLRKKSNELVAKNIQSYAAKKKEEAKDSIAKAKDKLAGIDQTKVTSSKDIQTSYQRADENLKAADESLVAAEDFFSSEKYEDSISRSEEAIRLSRIVVDQSDDIAERIKSGASVAGRTGTGEEDRNATVDGAEGKTTHTKTKTTGTSGKASASSGELPEGWKRYVVRKRVPADCLWRIASYKQHYGTGRLWKRIYDANKGKIKNPSLIYPKQVLLIPPRKGSTKFDPKKAKKKHSGSDEVEAVTDEKKKSESTTTPKPDAEEEHSEEDHSQNPQPQAEEQHAPGQQQAPAADQHAPAPEHQQAPPEEQAPPEQHNPPEEQSAPPHDEHQPSEGQNTNPSNTEGHTPSSSGEEKKPDTGK
ncbi:PF14346 domain protein [Leptospira broomii serovar Hurstbridge str. 5399]|uniref:PF14346 domain protein n=1 Tax=Leptospira broomii serovar Hurstbridge str. 5399 TaxID=1049789 RepID=T0FBB1_9LEPT|nr:lipoprotein LipL71 [Leptospira broomii]EQA45151.1 PF14346 domain protein [Leptospira broomii serovar Hurstbridge str. 5399]